MENPIKIHDLGGKPQFLETPILNQLVMKNWKVTLPEN